MTDGHGHGRRPAPCRGINVAAAVTSLSRVFTVGDRRGLRSIAST